MVECWETTIAPALFEEEDLPTEIENRTVLVAAHSNTLRMLMAYFDEVAEEKVPELYVPNAVPIIYRFDPATRSRSSAKRLEGERRLARTVAVVGVEPRPGARLR